MNRALPVGLAAALLLGGLAALGPPPALAGSQDLAGKRIAVDAGHGGTDPGAQGFGLNEKDVNLDVARRVRDLLEAEGATVLMTRDCDCTVSLQQRTDDANAWGAHRFISIHSNACGGCGGKGTETYYHTSQSSSSTSAKLATVLQDEVVDHLQTTDRGVKQANFHVLRETTMPAALVELAFIDTPVDNDKLKSPTWRQEAARGILHAVQRHFGIAPHDPVTNPPFAVAITAPADGAWQRGAVTARGTSNQESNLNWMRFLVDGQVTKWVTPPPHEWTWDTTPHADGDHALRLEGENKAGARASHGVTVKVDNTPPDAAITSPRPRSVYVEGIRVAQPLDLIVAAGDVPFEASATDPSPGSGMAKVVFLVDGAARHTDTAAPWAWTWPAGREALGRHTVSIQAHDQVGNVRTASLVVDLTVPFP